MGSMTWCSGSGAIRALSLLCLTDRVFRSLAGFEVSSGMPANSFEQIVQAVHELLGGGVGGELVGEPAGVLPAIGFPAGSGGFERGEADGVGVQGPVGAPGSGFVGAGSPQDVEHGGHALDRRWGDHGVAEVDV